MLAVESMPSDPIASDAMPQTLSDESVPTLLRCANCGRTCMSLAAHEKVCDYSQNSDMSASSLSSKLAPAPTPRTPPASTFAWDERPATAPSIRETWVELEYPPKPPEHVPCPTCGRRFTAERLLVHRRACAGQALPGYRAVVGALDRTEKDEELFRQATKDNEILLRAEKEASAAMQVRAETAEARAQSAERTVAELTSKLEREKAAAKSMEAAYDVVAEAASDAKAKVAELVARAEAAEKALEAMTSKAERAEAAAKSMEAAYDVVADALDNAKKRAALVDRVVDEAQTRRLSAEGPGGSISAPPPDPAPPTTTPAVAEEEAAVPEVEEEAAAAIAEEADGDGDIQVL